MLRARCPSASARLAPAAAHAPLARALLSVRPARTFLRSQPPRECSPSVLGIRWGLRRSYSTDPAGSHPPSSATIDPNPGASLEAPPAAASVDERPKSAPIGRGDGYRPRDNRSYQGGGGGGGGGGGSSQLQTAKDYNQVISKYVKMEKYNMVFKLIKEMQDKRLVPTLETLNNVIRAYLASGLTHKAWKTFEEIESYKLTPNIFTLNCLVEASLFKDDLEEAYGAIEMFKTKYDISANAYTYIQFINAYTRRGDLNKAFEQLEKMKQQGIPYLTPTYEAILTACIKLKDISRTAEILEAMTANKLLAPNSSVLLSLLKLATTEDNMLVAGHVMTHLQRSDTAVLTQGQLLELLDSAARKERPDFAETMWQWMKRQKNTPDLLAFDSLLYAYVNAKDMKKALSVLNAMHEAGVAPHPPTLIYFQTHLLTTVEAMDQAYYALEDLANEGEKVSPAALCMIVAACSHAADLERAYLTYNAYEKFGLTPGIDAVNALLEGCTRTKSAGPAFKIMQDLQKSGLQPNEKTFENLISNDIDTAIDVLNNLPPTVAPNYKMFSSIVRRCALNGEVAKASIIVESMRACGMEPQESLVAFIESDGKIPLQPKLRYHRNAGWMHRGTRTGPGFAPGERERERAGAGAGGGGRDEQYQQYQQQPRDHGPGEAPLAQTSAWSKAKGTF